MSYNIPTKRILKQLKDDLIGKDSHRGITLTYSWLANQFGHLALGFIPAFLLYQLFFIDEFKAALYVAIAWFIFETYNFLGPLLSKKESTSDVVFIPKKEAYTFKPKWGNVAFDTFTDVCFFASGAFLFALSINKGSDFVTNVILIALGLYLLFATRYWFVTKMYQFYARFPFQFRLSQWDFSLSKINKTKIDAFLTSTKDAGNHLLITGSLSKGKTSLGIGVLNELSIKHNTCLYVNAMKMYNYFFKDEGDILEAHEIWNWKSVQFLMIDDINPSKPIEDELITPPQFLSFVDTLHPINQKNREVLKTKNIIWVLGNDLAEHEECEWEKLLVDIGVQKENITTINL